MDEREKAIALAGSMGRAVDIVLATEDAKILGAEDLVAATAEVAELLFNTQAELYARLVAGPTPKGRSSNGGQSRGSSTSSPARNSSGGPSDKQVKFFKVLAGQIEKAGGEVPYSLDEFEASSAGRDGTASQIIDEMVELRDELR